MGNNLLPTRSDKNSKIMFGGNMIPALSLDLLNKDRKSHIDTAAIGAIPENEKLSSEPLWPGTFKNVCFRGGIDKDVQWRWEPE